MGKATPKKRPTECCGALPAYCDSLQKSIADVQGGDIAQAIVVWQHHAANLAAVREIRPSTRKLIECKGLAECLLDRLHTAANVLVGKTVQRLLGDSTPIYQSGLICKRLCQDWDRWKSGTVVLWPGCIGDNVDRLSARDRKWVQDSEPQLDQLRLALSELSRPKPPKRGRQTDNKTDKKPKKINRVVTDPVRKCGIAYRHAVARGYDESRKKFCKDWVLDNGHKYRNESGKIPCWSTIDRALQAHPELWQPTADTADKSADTDF
ncbi:MAG: hypothetical protein WBL72_06185 [Thermoguttaceae bacterium]